MLKPAAALALAFASSAFALDADSLRLRRAPGGVELSWTDPTPTVACVLRDASAPPVTLLQQVSGPGLVDPAPSVPLLFYDVDEPLSGSCTALPPRCSAAGALACGDTVAGRTDDPGASSVLSAHPGCFAAGLEGPEVVYAFTASASDDVEARLMAGGSAADVLVLQDDGSGCMTSPCIAYGDVSTTFATTPGASYFLVVDAPAGPAVGYTLALTCAGAQCVPDQPLLCGQAIAHNNAWPVGSDAVDSYPCSSFGYPGPEYAFRFTATGGGQATAALSGLTAELDVFVVEEGAGCSGASCVAWGDTTADFALVAGTTYDVIVDGRDGAEGFFRLDLSCTTPPSACDPHDAIRCGDLVGNDSAAGRDAVDAWPCAAIDASGPEYVHLFAPDEDAIVRVVMDLAVQDLDLFVVENGAGGCSPAGCIAWGDAEVTFAATAGRVYSIVVDGRAGATDTFRLWMDCRRVPGACRPVAPIGCGETVSGRNDAPGSTDAIDAYACRPYPEEGPEITYAFTAGADGTARVTLSNLGADLDVFVLRDDGLGCSEGSCLGGANATLDVPVVAGATYFVVVEGFSGAAGSFDLTLECF